MAAVGPQTRRGHQLWTRRVGPRAQYRAAAGLGGPGCGSAGPWATGCWGPLVTSAGRGRCPRSLSKVLKLETSLPRFPAPVAEATGLCGWCPRGPRGRSHRKRGPGSSLAAGLGDPFSHSSAACLPACPSARPSIHPSVLLSVFEDDPPTLLRPALRCPGDLHRMRATVAGRRLSLAAPLPGGTRHRDAVGQGRGAGRANPTGVRRSGC